MFVPCIIFAQKCNKEILKGLHGVQRNGYINKNSFKVNNYLEKQIYNAWQG